MAFNEQYYHQAYFTLAEFSPTEEDRIKTFGKCYNIDIVNSIK